MKRSLLVLLTIALGLSVSNAQTAKISDSLSYAIGTNIGLTLQTFPAKLDVAIISQAINDAITGNPSMTLEQSESFIQDYFMNQQTRATEKNKRDGEEFLNANKDKPGVITLPSGLQYKIERAGAGASPTINDTVEVHYRGTLIDGREFDSSYSRGETIKFPLKGVIKGWTEGLQHVNEGGKIWLYIPSDLAYGDTSRSAIIEGGSTLIFEIELIQVIKK